MVDAGRAGNDQMLVTDLVSLSWPRDEKVIQGTGHVAPNNVDLQGSQVTQFYTLQGVDI